MSLCLKAYEFAKSDMGLCEINGNIDNETILDMHACTTYFGKHDEVPWCSSAMNYWMLKALAATSPAATWKMIQEHLPFKQQGMVMTKVGILSPVETVTPPPKLLRPTFSAAAISWINWGKSVKQSPQEGDICIFKRPGGHHVAFYQKKALGFITCLGGNQNNKVCSKLYPKLMLLDIRRG